MTDFEFLRNITIGQYIPAESPLHRMDPRAKLLGVLFLTLAVTSTRSILASLLLLGLLLALTRVARLEITYVLRGLIPGLGILGFILLMQLLFQGQNAPCETMWFSWRFVQISPCLLQLMLLGLIRVLIFLFLISLLTLTTTASHLTNASEMLLSPFRRVGLPAHEIALASTIALRFIPTLAEELERIMKAQASRGNDLGAAPWYRLDRMVRERIPLIVPLFIGALRRAEDLIVAMEARGYVGGKGRTKFVRFAGRWTDWAAVAATAAIWLAVWRIPWPF
jgi:energy-coupling factor transport system permease protein